MLQNMSLVLLPELSTTKYGNVIPSTCHISIYIYRPYMLEDFWALIAWLYRFASYQIYMRYLSFIAPLVAQDWTSTVASVCRCYLCWMSPYGDTVLVRSHVGVHPWCKWCSQNRQRTFSLASVHEFLEQKLTLKVTCTLACLGRGGTGRCNWLYLFSQHNDLIF